jgi:hypothetical protein
MPLESHNFNEVPGKLQKVLDRLSAPRIKDLSHQLLAYPLVSLTVSRRAHKVRGGSLICPGVLFGGGISLAI